MLERQQARLYYMRQQILLYLAAKCNLFDVYSDALIEKFRNVYYGGMSASILLLHPETTKHKCWDSCVLVALALEDMDYQVVCAHIEGIKYNPRVMQEVATCKEEGKLVNPNYDVHYFVEVDFKNKTWVIDTTLGKLFEKHIYYAIERPKIVRVFTKEQMKEDWDYQDIVNGSLEKDKYMSVFTLPVLEAKHKETETWYSEKLEREIELYKKTIDYETLKEEAFLKRT